MVDSLEEKFSQAREGRKIWLSLVDEYKVDYDKVVYIMPHNDAELNKTCIAYKDEVLASKRAKELLILVSESTKNSILGYDENVIVISDYQMTCLMKYNDMTEFSSQSIVVSFLYGSDHDARYLQNIGLTREELILVGILNIKNEIGE